MNELLTRFVRDGFLVIDELASSEEISELIACIAGEDRVGSRNLLELGPVQVAALNIRRCSRLEALLGHYVTVQCTSFIKSQSKNWAVRLHRDRVIPAQGGEGWKSSGTKDGMQFVRPPQQILQQLVAVRLSLDHAAEGDLQVIPGSHTTETESDRSAAVVVPVRKGGALVMQPLLEHASTKLKNSRARRVLHFLFGPPQLPRGYRWYHAV